MKYNLTHNCLDAKAKASGWSKEKLIDVVNLILSLVGTGKLDWDIGAGEDWARILGEKETIAFIRVDFPLAIVREAYATTLRAALEKTGVVSIFVPDFERRLYELSMSELGNIFPRWHTEVEIIDPQNFSIDELWYATI